MKKYLLFDLDGTLTDPKIGITTCVQYALQSFGIEEPDLDKLEPFIGPPLRDSFKRFYGFNDEQAEAAVAKYRERFEKVGMFENEVYQGIPQMLRTLQSKGLYLAVASSKPQVYVEQILEHFDLKKYFKVIVGCELDGTRENKDEVVQEALNRLFAYKPIQKDQVYMIGDRCFDVEGAKARGVESVGVTYGFGDIEELKSAKADYIVRSVEELEKFLLRGVEEERKLEEQKKGLTLGNMWVMLFAFLMFVGVRSVVTYAVELLCVRMWDMGLPAWLDRFLFIRDAAKLQEGAQFAFTGNQAAIRSMLGFIGGALVIRKDALQLIRSTAEDTKLSHLKKEPKGNYALLALAAAGAAVSLNLLLDLLGLVDKSAAYQAVRSDQYAAVFWLGLAAYGVVSPVAEELLFRGIIHNYLRRFYPARLALLVSSMLFGLYHMNFVQGMYGFLMGCLIAYGYEFFGDFRVAVAVHAGVNILVYCLSYTALAGLSAERLPVCVMSGAVAVVCLMALSRKKNVL